MHLIGSAASDVIESLAMSSEVILSKRCKGPGHPHYILPAYKGVHINEILGYCMPCWIRQLVYENNSPMVLSPKRKPYSDSKINPNSGPCSNETL